MFATKRDIASLEETLRKTEPRQVFEPEEFTAYSNWGVALAGYIVERISGQAFYEYVHENIFAVLGMNHTALNADLSDNIWVKEQHESLRYYTASGGAFNIPSLYIPLYPAGMATGTLSDFLRFARALLPDSTGHSLLFQEERTLQEFLATSLYYADGKTTRNSHGFWAGIFAVPVIGHGGNTAGCSAHLQISPSSGVGVVLMTNQSNEGIYNYQLMPLVFGEQEVYSGAMPDVSEMACVYLNTRTTYSGMLKCLRLSSIMPFVKSADNVLSVFLAPTITAEQVKPSEYRFNLMDMRLMLKAHIGETRSMMSIPMFDYVKTSPAKVIFWIASVILLLLSAVYALVSLICTLIRRLKRKAPESFGSLRVLNDTSVILCLINFCVLMVSSFVGTYTTVFIQGIFFIIFAIFPVIYTTMWIKSKQKGTVWQILSSVAGFIMIFNVLFWDLYMIC